jgi:hypothetical protein
MRNRCVVIAATFLLPVLPIGTVAAQSAPDLDGFIPTQTLTSLELSPNGQHLAGILLEPEGYRVLEVSR